MKRLALIALASTSIVGIPSLAKADSYYLVLGSYKQPDASGKPRIAKSSSPSITVIPMVSLEQCEVAGQQIQKSIYEPIWFFDGRWTCVEGK